MTPQAPAPANQGGPRSLTDLLQQVQSLHVRIHLQFLCRLDADRHQLTCVRPILLTDQDVLDVCLDEPGAHERQLGRRDAEDNRDRMWGDGLIEQASGLAGCVRDLGCGVAAVQVVPDDDVVGELLRSIRY